MKVLRGMANIYMITMRILSHIVYWQPTGKISKNKRPPIGGQYLYTVHHYFGKEKGLRMIDLRAP